MVYFCFPLCPGRLKVLAVFQHALSSTIFSFLFGGMTSCAWLVVHCFQRGGANHKLLCWTILGALTNVFPPKAKQSFLPAAKQTENRCCDPFPSTRRESLNTRDVYSLNKSNQGDLGKWWEMVCCGQPASCREPNPLVSFLADEKMWIQWTNMWIHLQGWLEYLFYLAPFFVLFFYPWPLQNNGLFQ